VVAGLAVKVALGLKHLVVVEVVEDHILSATSLPHCLVQLKLLLLEVVVLVGRL
jgi:hypothetical protein